MYVSYLLDKDVSMYPSSVRHSGGLNLAPQNFVSPPQYPDYGGYHVAAAAAAAANLDSAQSPGPSWPSAYGAPLREDWNGYAPGGAAAAANAVAHGLNGGSPGAAMGYSSSSDYHPHHHPHHHAHHPAAAPSCASGLLQTLSPGPPGPPAEQLSPGGQRRNLCDWMRKPAQPSLGSQVKTRTKDKYRVVYTDHQRLELEKEFHYSRYITIRRKAELAATLGLSERQVKIWFQNRRAKERKINKKKLQQQQQQQQPPQSQPPQPQPGPLRSVPESLSPVSSLQGSVPGSVPGVLGPAGGVINPTVTQ
ncbi:homeobox protein CDX-2 [Rhynchocyon petersi]